jgi:hypothetical protein
MEVHTHTHPSANSGTRKKWTHYFWEFLMLFLAVFCGFLAENQREHFVEHKKAKEYAKSLYTDLKNDTVSLNKGIVYLRTANQMIDSLFQFETEYSDPKKGGQLNLYLRFATWVYSVDLNKATINQLINSGNLRYFSNPGLVTKISMYNTIASKISVLEDLIFSAAGRAAVYKDELLDSKHSFLFSRINIDDISYGTNNKLIDSLKSLSIPVFSTDPGLMNKYRNAIIGIKGPRNYLIGKFYPEAIKQALEIMELLKNEYRLNNNDILEK